MKPKTSAKMASCAFGQACMYTRVGLCQPWKHSFLNSFSLFLPFPLPSIPLLLFASYGDSLVSSLEERCSFCASLCKFPVPSHMNKAFLLLFIQVKKIPLLSIVLWQFYYTMSEQDLFIM